MYIVCWCAHNFYHNFFAQAVRPFTGNKALGQAILVVGVVGTDRSIVKYVVYRQQMMGNMWIQIILWVIWI